MCSWIFKTSYICDTLVLEVSLLYQRVAKLGQIVINVIKGSLKIKERATIMM